MLRFGARAEGESMAIGPGGTFQYIFEVPHDFATSVNGRPLNERKPGQEKMFLGSAPTMEATEYERQPWQLFARVDLRAWTRRVSFSVDRGMIRVLRKGDEVCFSRSSCGGIGMSIVRDDMLIAAAGAIHLVPLGSDVHVRVPVDLIAEAEAVLQRRDPKYRMHDQPVEISVGDETLIIHSGRPRLGPYDVFMRHGFLRGLPGEDCSISIERVGVCPDTAAHTTAQLLHDERYELE